METALTIPEPETQEQKDALQQYQSAVDWREVVEQARRSKEINVTDAGQAELISEARQLRLALKRARNSIENRRKEIKEKILVQTRAIDGVANMMKAIIMPAEEHLEAQEKFVEVQEEKRLAAMEANRQGELSKYVGDTSFYNLKTMSEEGFRQLLENSRIAWQAQKDAAEKAESDRKAKEKADADERERIKAENKRLQDEREAADRKAEDERKKREKAEADAKAIKDAQDRKDKAERDAKEKAEKDKKAAERRARMAPDKDKLEAYAAALSAVPAPQVKSDEAQEIVSAAILKLSPVITFIKQRAASL